MIPNKRPKLIVGLGNPGDDYKYTRHNVGAWFVHALGHKYGAPFKADRKFKGEVAEVVIKGYKIRLLFPTTFMNLSGQAVRALTDYYSIEPEEILVAHDELDLPVGEMRLKFSGGHGGHNGLRDTSQHMGKDYWRLRIGVGHPGNRKQVSNYLTNQKTPRDEEEQILVGIEKVLKDFEYLLSEGYEKAMHKLHSKPQAEKKPSKNKVSDKKISDQDNSKPDDTKSDVTKSNNQSSNKLIKRKSVEGKQLNPKTALAMAFQKAKKEEE